MNTTTMSRKEVEKRIKEIEATPYDPDLCVGHDEGTHTMPATHSVYETIGGERYAIRRDRGTVSRITVEQAEDGTHGRIRYSRDAIDRIVGLRAELKRLREQLRKMK